MKSSSANSVISDALKRSRKRRKVHALAQRPGTAEEGDAARRAVARLDAARGGIDDLVDWAVDLKERADAFGPAPGPDLAVSRRKQRQATLTKGAAKDPDSSKKPLHLNNKFVEALPAGEMWWDDDPKSSGFGVRTYVGGGKSFFIDYRIDGRQRRLTIGPFPRWSADSARGRAKELRKQIDQGHDPAGAKRVRREAPTIQDLIDRYIADHLPKKSSEKMRVADEKKMLDEIGKHLGKHTKVVDIHGGDVAEMHRKISASVGRGGKPRRVRANRILAIASKMFSLTLVPKAGETLPWRHAVLGNPCKGIERNPEEGRERFFSQGELSAISDLWRGIPVSPRTACA